MSNILRSIMNEIELIPEFQVIGNICSVRGLLMEAIGIEFAVSIGSKCKIINKNEREMFAEVVGIKEKKTLLITYDSAEGIGIGSQVHVIAHDQSIYPSAHWIVYPTIVGG